MKVTADTPRAIEKAVNANALGLTDFFRAWGIPAPIIKERLRQSGFRHIDAGDLSNVDSDDLLTINQSCLLEVVISELKNDINKISKGHSAEFYPSKMNSITLKENEDFKAKT